MSNERLTADEYKAEASRHFQSAQDSFDRCDTDGFLSQWASDLSGRLAHAKATLAANDWQAEFPALYGIGGERLPAKLIRGQYGLCWAFCDASGKFTGRFVGMLDAEPAECNYCEAAAYRKAVKAWERKRDRWEAKHGVKQGTELAAANAAIKGSGTGLSGAASCYVETFRTDGGYPGAKQ